MRLLDRYLLAEWLKVFGLAVGATLAVLVLHDVYGNIGDLISYGTTPGQMVLYYAVLGPSLLPYVLPLSEFVALLFVLGHLHRNHEITAMRAAGLSLWRIARPLWLGGAGLALALWALNATAVPWSAEHSRELRDAWRDHAEAKEHDPRDVGVVTELTYDNRRQNRVWFIDRFSDFANRARGVLIYETDARGRDQRSIAAQEGYFDDTRGFWVLQKGNITTYDNDARPLKSPWFDEQTFPEFTETPALMQLLRARPADLSLHQLAEALREAPPEANPAMNPYAVQYAALLASPFACLVVVGFAVPFAVAGVRASPMVGVCKAVGLFFVYYLVSSLCTVLGNQQMLAPVLAAWTPNLLMLGAGLWLFRRAA